MLGSSQGILRLSTSSDIIYHLPVRFIASVLAAGKQTSLGRWYKLQIGQHEINLQSAVELSVGAQYRLEKLSPLQLKIVEKIIFDEKEEVRPKSETVPMAVDKDSVSNLIGLNNFQQLLTQISLLDQELENKIIIEQYPQRFFFTLSISALTEPLDGIILMPQQQEEKPRVLLAFGEDERQFFKNVSDQTQFIDELKFFLGELQVKDVSLISKRQLQQLKQGIDLTR